MSEWFKFPEDITPDAFNAILVMFVLINAKWLVPLAELRIISAAWFVPLVELRIMSAAWFVPLAARRMISLA